jgi:hypothetical protein
MAIAILESVTVSMAALSNGIFKGMFLVRCVAMLTSDGSKSLLAGSSKTSSKVRASLILFASLTIYSPLAQFLY